MDVQTTDGILVVMVPQDRIDAACSVAFKDAMRRALDGHQGRVVLDVSGVEFVDSSGLGALVAVMKMLTPRKLELAGSGTMMLKVLTLTRMDRVFVLHDDVDAALAPRHAA